MSRLDPTATRIAFRPRFFDRVCVFFLVLPCLGSFVLAFAMFTVTPKAETVHCDRASGRCTYFFPAPFGGDTYSDQIANFRRSKVITGKHGGASWKVERVSKPLWLGSETSDPATVERYKTFAGDLQAFLDDPARPAFDAVLPPAPIQRFPLIFSMCFGLLLGWFGFRWWRGWYAELELDPAQRTITIHRRPMFFTGPRRVTRHVKELRLVEAVENRYIGRGQRAKFAHFELREQTSGKRVFKYLALYDGKTRAQLDGDLALLAQFFQSS